MSKYIKQVLGLICVLVLTITTTSVSQAGIITTPWILPNADGTTLQWSVSPSSQTHYTAVDDPSCNNSDYIYVHPGILPKVDEFRIPLSSVPNGTLVYRIDIIVCMAEYIEDMSAPGAYVDYIVMKDGSYLTGWGWSPWDLGTTFVEFGGSSLAFTPFSKNALTNIKLRVVSHDYPTSAKVSRVALKFYYQL